MKRFHLHLSVSDLDASVRFYTTLFAEQPSVQQVDYRMPEEAESAEACCEPRVAGEACCAA